MSYMATTEVSCQLYLLLHNWKYVMKLLQKDKIPGGLQKCLTYVGKCCLPFLQKRNITPCKLIHDFKHNYNCAHKLMNRFLKVLSSLLREASYNEASPPLGDPAAT